MSAIGDSAVQQMIDARAAEILGFWFDEHAKDWFVKNPAFDVEIRSRFVELHAAAAAGQLAHWADEGRSCLALTILLDQLPRNMFRGEARAFATDALARAAARAILDREWDKPMTQSEQMFAYLPFEHSESLDDQNLACELMKDFDAEQLRYAVRHREIIERFGRFPHRNSILGRQSTAAEIEFLRQPGSAF
jgi:uncharacterized protein (DUF924 family)